ncbi:SHOCT domain-containing protein [Mobilitalea sibirica]|uniref:SHOCT domain-containing protein n=1 Tax=Mobilitalea sibirica TaxID=1462919 RepID=A0A8J7H0T7_9FIRM|nr:SHOCT domain-containing protein [Mobilitalea sibirica]MBH1939839.1 SHOCT domain-containing protein [Mobilitalea sibirica]
MMYRYFNDSYGNGFCSGFGFFNNGWGITIGVGLLIIIALLFYLFVHNNKKKRASSETLENLKLLYVKGDITEDEYLRRKSVIER